MLSPQCLANALRVLSIEAIQKANSGHPGMPLGMADIAEVLWNNFLKHNPKNPSWVNRDRFVLSNGHGSMLHYSLLHLTGYDLSIEDLKHFRSIHSKTPGHPEVDEVPGVETTTGPLGQGLANGVGMALAEKILAARFNQPDITLVDHHTYVFVGDGCLMEGISHEACSLAGTWGLGKLIVFWDDNKISIDGNVSGWFTDDTALRFRSYGWNVIPNVNGHDAAEILKAIKEAHKNHDRPTLICCQTTIGFGSPNKAGLAKCHGSPLGADEVIKTKEKLCWQFGAFEIPAEIYRAWNACEKGKALEEKWNTLFAAYQSKYPDLAKEFKRSVCARDLPIDWNEFIADLLKKYAQKNEKMASRKMSQQVLNDIGPKLPELIGGSADLTESNLTGWRGCRVFQNKTLEDANYIEYGIREFGMSAIMNGLALHGGFIPYGGTFLVFCQYAMNAVRMAALMKKRVIFVYTHDSIGVGEDGPTHQPIEQLASLRLIPNMSVWRPCSMLEMGVAWKAALERRDGPTALIVSRQDIPAALYDQNLDIHGTVERGGRGGYVIFDCTNKPKSIIIATGSEVALAIEAAKKLQEEKIPVRVVSMPSIDVFLRQDESYRESVIPSSIRARVAVEAGTSCGWYQFVGDEGAVVGIDRFGLSAPAEEICKDIEFTVETVVSKVKKVIKD